MEKNRGLKWSGFEWRGRKQSWCQGERLYLLIKIYSMRAGNQLNIFNTLIEWVFHTASSTLEPDFIVFVHLFAEKTPRKDSRSGPKCEKLVSSLSWMLHTTIWSVKFIHSMIIFLFQKSCTASGLMAERHFSISVLLFCPIFSYGLFQKYFLVHFLYR